MATIEDFVRCFEDERQGTAALLWMDNSELLYALALFLGASKPPGPLIFRLHGSAGEEAAWNRTAESRRKPGRHRTVDEKATAGKCWVVVPDPGEATRTWVGPLLNGHRFPLSEPSGSLLVVHHRDYDAFQRSAPDLTSYVGGRLFDSASLLSICSPRTKQSAPTTVPAELREALVDLPGPWPDDESYRKWADETLLVNDQ